MNCPKCDHSQQGDIECESCGIVFDRYFNLIAKKKLDEAIQLYNEGKYQVALAAFNAIINAKTFKDKLTDEQCQEYINKIKNTFAEDQQPSEVILENTECYQSPNQSQLSIIFGKISSFLERRALFIFFMVSFLGKAFINNTSQNNKDHQSPNQSQLSIIFGKISSFIRRLPKELKIIFLISIFIPFYIRQFAGHTNLLQYAIQALFIFVVLLFLFAVYVHSTGLNLSGLIVLSGICLLIYSLNMDVSVDSYTYGVGRVSNLELMNSRQNYTIISGILILAGLSVGMLYLFRKKQNSINDNYAEINDNTRMECPKCAEMIKCNAKQCRFCGFIINSN